MYVGWALGLWGAVAYFQVDMVGIVVMNLVEVVVLVAEAANQGVSIVPYTIYLI